MILEYKKKPVSIRACKWTGNNYDELKEFVGGSLTVDINRSFLRSHDFDMSLTIKTLEGDMKVSLGDYIIKGVRGEFYPCKAGIFEETYERV